MRWRTGVPAGRLFGALAADQGGWPRADRRSARRERSEQAHTVFLVLDVDGGPVPFNFGIGRGLTASADHWTVKAIFELPL